MPKKLMRTLFLVISVICLMSCGNNRSQEANETLVELKSDRIEALFFQSPQRCVICNNIKMRTQELLDSLYKDELANGEIVFRIIEISKKENELILDSYEAAWTSLFINHWSNGIETRHNMTEYAITYSMRPAAEFKEGLKNKIEELRKH